MKEKVVLVNEENQKIGLEEKQKAHVEGLLHRAISVLIFNSKGEMLLQQRAQSKYHWPMKWSNACCTHPRDNESFLDAAERRTREELGITIRLTELYRFVYKAEDEETSLIEHEYDVVFKGMYDQHQMPFNTDEVNDVKWISIHRLKEDIKSHPEMYTFWFREIVEKLYSDIDI